MPSKFNLDSWAETSGKTARSAVGQRIKKQVMQRINAREQLFEFSQSNLEENLAKTRVWDNISQRIKEPASAGLLDNIREAILVPTRKKPGLKRGTVQRLQPVVATPVTFSAAKWTAAFAIVALVFRVSPVFFIATPSSAQTQATLRTTQGIVEVSRGEMWQQWPVNRVLTLQDGMMLRTQEGEATAMLHDDVIVRLAPNTRVQFVDTSDHLGPAPQDAVPTVRLFSGDLHVFSLVPAHIRPTVVAVGESGMVSVNEGSVSISNRDEVVVHVLNRRAIVSNSTDSVVLVSGERTTIQDNRLLLVKKFSPDYYDEARVAQNLSRDGVHQLEVAQLQKERRAAQAGILPTSKLYPVKLAAEKVDQFFTFNDEERKQKQIAQAETRFNEAAALLAEENPEAAAVSLAEYRAILLALAEDPEGNMLTQFLVQQSLLETSAEVAAAQPHDSAYLLKQAALETSAAFEGDISSTDIEAVLMMDTLNALTTAVEAGEVAEVEDTWLGLQPYLALVRSDDTALQPDIQKEVLATLARFAVATQEHEQLAGLAPEFIIEVEQYLPAPSSQIVQMSTEELELLVQAIRDRIFVYRLDKSQLTQFINELKAIRGHPDEGLILRELNEVLPGNRPQRFQDRIKKQMTTLRWEKAAAL